MKKKKQPGFPVAPEELSLAIGKEGQNVRLASKLTGYRIEIEGDEKLSKEPTRIQAPVEEVSADAQVPAEESQKQKKEHSLAKATKGQSKKVVKEKVKVKEEELAKEASEVSDLAEKVGKDKTEDLGKEATEVAQSVKALKEEAAAETPAADVKSQAKDEEKEEDDAVPTSNG